MNYKEYIKNKFAEEFKEERKILGEKMYAELLDTIFNLSDIEGIIKEIFDIDLSGYTIEPLNEEDSFGNIYQEEV